MEDSRGFRVNTINEMMSHDLHYVVNVEIENTGTMNLDKVYYMRAVGHGFGVERCCGC